MVEKLKIPETGFLVSYKPTNVKRTSTVSNISSPMNNQYNYLRQTPSSSDNQNTPDDQTDKPFQWSYRTTPGLTGYGMPGNIKFNGQTRSINDVLNTYNKLLGNDETVFSNIYNLHYKIIQMY